MKPSVYDGCEGKVKMNSIEYTGLSDASENSCHVDPFGSFGGEELIA